MAVGMGVREADRSFLIRFTRGEVSGTPVGVSEAHALSVEKTRCEIIAPDVEGMRRAILRLEEEMRIRRAPVLPLGRQVRWTPIKVRISRNPFAPYRWLSGWELEDENDYYPEDYLKRLSRSGVNGLWVPGLLRNLVASGVIPELGPDTHRLEKLKRLVDKAARHGIRIYLFVIEPRALPEGHPAGLTHPEILGAQRALCTSVPLVRDYIRDVMATLFQEVPDLAGVINIFCGERPSNCWLTEKLVQECPRCRERSKTEVMAEILDAFVDGMRSSSPSAEFLAWTYMMASSTESLPIAPMLDVMNASSPEVIWLGNFEHGSKKQVCGKDIEVHEYSLSCVGPSPHFRDLAQAAGPAGRTLYAKLQMGTSYEMSSVPYIPVPGIAYDKMEAAAGLGVEGAMLGWIVGGYPSPMLRAAGEAAFEPRLPKEEFLLRLAAVEWGEKAAVEVARAWTIFSETWQKYPFHNAVLYWGPMTRAPAYHLQLEREPRLAKPYNWGYDRSRTAQPFEDQYQRWLGFYTLQEITGSFRYMAECWKNGVDLLESALRKNRGDSELERQVAVAAAVRWQCLATANAYEFYALRDALRESDPSAHPALLEKLANVVRDDLHVAREVKVLLAVDPTIGFQSEIYDYSYSLPLVEAKIVQASATLKTLERWRQNGVEREILARTVEDTELMRPDWNPDRWGD